jgi:hypothetical protein
MSILLNLRAGQGLRGPFFLGNNGVKTRAPMLHGPRLRKASQR